MTKIVVIGGGASGFFGAINTAINYPDADIVILEASPQVLAKVKISGGGRCNVTHHCFNAGELVSHYPRGGKELRGAFSRFQPQDTINWFESRGVKLKTEGDGRIFPVTNDSQTIIDCLLTSALHHGIKIQTKTLVKDIEKENQQFFIKLKSGEIIKADKILLATGSNLSGYQWAEKLGHTIIKPIPSLFTFKIKDSRLENLAGVSVSNAQIQLGKKAEKITQNGALLVTHWGLSGPAILKTSAWGARILFDHNYQMSLIINWLNNGNTEIVKQDLEQIKIDFAKQKITNFNGFSLPKRLWQSIVKYVLDNHDKIWAELNKKELNKLALELTQGVYQISGKGVFKEEFVTCGGVSLKEVNFINMESKICQGLFLAGEILDIDGVTGGFNFQNAWTTGWLAGRALGEKN